MPSWIVELSEAVRRQGFLMSLMAGSILLSIASFYTTHDGMLNFMPQALIAFCITFAVQALLFVTSWRIGFDLAAERGWPLFTIFVFVTCFIGSVFFSWVALFDAINDEELQQRTRMTRTHSALEETISELRGRAIERRRDAAATLVETDAYQRWRDDVGAVTEAALASREALEDSLRRQAADRAGQLARIETQIAAAKAEAERSNATLETGQAALERAEARKPGLVERVAKLEIAAREAADLVALKEAEMAAEEAGAAGEGRGQGPLWRQLRDERDQLAARAEGQRRLLAAAEADLDAVNAKIRETSGVIGSASAQEGAALKQLEAERQRIVGQAQSASGAEQFDLTTEVRALRDSLSAFEARQDLDQFTRAAGLCAALLSEMRRQPELQTRTVSLSCEPKRMGAALNPIDDAASSLAALEARCAPGGAEARPIESLGFNEAIDYGRNCLTVSGLPAGETDDLRAEIDRLELEEDPNASAFVKTMNALFGGEKLAYFALAIAISIDALVLFSGLVGAQNQGPAAMTMNTEELLSNLMRVNRGAAEPSAELARERLQLVLTNAMPAPGASPRQLRRALGSKGVARRPSPPAIVELSEIDQAQASELRQALTFCALAGLCQEQKDEPGHYRFYAGALNVLVELNNQLGGGDRRRTTVGDKRRARGQVSAMKAGFHPPRSGSLG